MVEARQVITVDGVGASGKSALARLLAERLGYAHLNSGLLYRAAAFLALSDAIATDDEERLREALKAHTIELKFNPSTGNQVLIDGVVRDSELQTQEISRMASQVAKLSSVREHFVPVQRRAFEPAGVVAEGRDMGTVIFPDASPKFFVTADIKIRAARRAQQLLAKGSSVDVESIERDLARRDHEDATRELSPMRAPEGAVLIDNSHGSLDEIVDRMFHAVTGK